MRHSVTPGSLHRATLLEAHSDRFFIGTDMLDGMGDYQERISFFRDVLAQLSPEAAKRIGYENAQRLLRLDSLKATEVQRHGEEQAGR